MQKINSMKKQGLHFIILLLLIIPFLILLNHQIKLSNLNHQVNNIEKQMNQSKTVSLVGGFDYQSMFETMTFEPVEFVNHIHKCYLTFDDGPSHTTLELLEILNQRNIKATFFVVGKQLENPTNAEILKQIVQQGHTIGIHTYSHDYVEIYSSVEAYLNDFYNTWQLVYEITGIKTQIFRFPGGSINSFNTTIYEKIIDEMIRRGFVFYDWNVSAQDAVQGIEKEDMYYHAIMGEGYENIILLMHDFIDNQEMLDILPQVIEYYQAKGYQFKAIDASIEPVTFNYP